MFNEKQQQEIRKIVIKNAIDYGKARKESALNKVLSKHPELKQNITALSTYIEKEVKEVNLMSKEEITSEAESFSEAFKSEEKERFERTAKPHFFLDGAVVGKFLTRFPPEPNGYMQIGHAKASFTEKEFTKIYDGKLALYFDDTNPDTERQEFVDAIKYDLEWLGIEYDMEYYASDNIEFIYGQAEKLISQNKAYACSCSPDEVKKSRISGIGCKHKRQEIHENMELWRAMLNNTVEDDIIIRLNNDLKALNTAMRDPTLFRIKTKEHYRQGTKYTVWPTYAFNTPIIDSIKGVTDVIRSKEFELLDELYFYILTSLNMQKPRIHSISRLKIKDNLTSKRKINELIKQGVLWGYDDPRLVTISGLRRRGITPNAIKEFSMRFGMSKSESKVDINMLLSENKKLIDTTSKRLFYVEKPLKVTVAGIPEEKKNVKLKLHPSSDLGYRTYMLSNIFFINTYDATNLIKDGDLRLKDAIDIKIESINKNGISARYVESSSSTAPRVQWVNEGNFISCNIYEVGTLLNNELFNKNSLSIKEGYVESYVESLVEGETVQFERVGFFKLDKNTEKPSFISL